MFTKSERFNRFPQKFSLPLAPSISIETNVGFLLASTIHTSRRYVKTILNPFWKYHFHKKYNFLLLVSANSESTREGSIFT